MGLINPIITDFTPTKKINISHIKNDLHKRDVFSKAARIYNPLGLLWTVIAKAYKLNATIVLA